MLVDSWFTGANKSVADGKWVLYSKSFPSRLPVAAFKLLRQFSRFKFFPSAPQTFPAFDVFNKSDCCYVFVKLKQERTCDLQISAKTSKNILQQEKPANETLLIAIIR